ncbi:MAG: E2/UBC family protein [Methylophilus sp.]|jgi:hypothetical protein|nr:E2/UBC family protein [Methylophilus sp.]
MSTLERQFEVLREKYPNATMAPLPSGASLITLPDMSLPAGWSQDKVTVKFLAPTGYPFAAPDCFWIDENVRLANGAMPQASNLSPIPEVNINHLWFSWHVSAWNASRDNLLSYVGVINNRFVEAK